MQGKLEGEGHFWGTLEHGETRINASPFESSGPVHFNPKKPSQKRQPQPCSSSVAKHDGAELLRLRPVPRQGDVGRVSCKKVSLTRTTSSSSFQFRARSNIKQYFPWGLARLLHRTGLKPE